MFCCRFFTKNGIVHRDISPSNILLTRQGKFILIDPSFVSQTGKQNTAIANEYYTAPEQLIKKATFQSDLYSIAATIPFLGSGRPPPKNDRTALKEQIKSVSFAYGSSPSFYNSFTSLFFSLLSDDILDRPQKVHHTGLSWITRLVPEMPPISGILDIKELGFLLIDFNGKEVYANELEINKYLLKILKAGPMQNTILKNDTASFYLAAIHGKNSYINRVFIYY